MIRIVSAEGALAFARPLVVFGFVLALIGIGQSALLSNKDGIVEKIYAFWQPRQGGNPFGPFVNRNHFAGWAIMVLPLAISSACAAWEQAKKTPGFDFRDRVSWLSTPRGAAMLLLAFAGSVIGLALLMTQSRSGLAAFTTATLMFAWVLVPRQTSRRGKVVAAMLIATLFVGATTWAGLDRIARRLSSQRSDTSTTARLGAWSDTLRIIEAFPVTGSGLNTYGTAMMVYQTGERRLHFQEAHNDYLQLAAEGGVLIGVPLLFTFAIFARDVRRRFREAPKEGTSYWLRVGAVVGLLAVALQSLVEFSLQMPGNAALFAVVAAIALHRSPNLRPAVEPAAPPGRTPA
jgi:O-Antigen ligase